MSAMKLLGCGLLSSSLLLGAAGCIAVGGNDHYTKPTLGRQLMDLKTARDTGAISPQEYEQAKDRLLHGSSSTSDAG